MAGAGQERVFTPQRNEKTVSVRRIYSLALRKNNTHAAKSVSQSASRWCVTRARARAFPSIVVAQTAKTPVVTTTRPYPHT